MEQRKANLDYSLGFYRPYLKNRLAKLSMLILSKTYPFHGILSHVTRLRENSLEGPATNHASFYGPGKLKCPFVASFLFSFSSMALPLDPLAQSVRV
jgi:hypothetical protein